MSSFKKTILIFSVIGVIILIFSAITFGKGVLLPAGLIDAVRSFFAGNPELHACDYKDGEIILIKPIATGVGEGRYEAGDIVAIRDGQELCRIAGDKDPLGTDEKTKLLPVYYPQRLTEEQKKELVEPEYATSTDATGKIGKDRILKRRQIGIDYTKFLSDDEILKIRSFEKLDKLPEIDLFSVIKKTPEQKSVVQISEYIAGVENFRNSVSKIVRKVIPFVLAAGSGTKTICPAGQGCNYNDLSTWEATEQGNLTGTGPAIAQIQGDWTGVIDTTALTIDSWTTTVADYIKVYTTAAARHNGVWDDGKYNLKLSDGDYIISPSVSNVKIIGLQMWGANTSGDFRTIYWNTPVTNLEFGYNIIRGNAAAGDTNAGIYLGGESDGSTANVYNSIFYNQKTYGIFNAYSDGSSVYVYNSTFVGPGTGVAISGDAGACIVKNTIVQNWSNGFGTGIDASSDYNLSNIADDASGDHSRNGVTVLFAGASDFHLDSNDTEAMNKGVDLNPDPDGHLTITDDIDGDTRPNGANTWDIGADEYVAEEPGTSCGDGTCNGVETHATCPADCPITQINTSDKLAGPQGGLVGNWSFDGQDMGTTSAADLSGNNYTGWLYGGIQKATGVSGQALKFDGVNDYVKIVPTSYLPNISISVWVKSPAAPKTTFDSWVYVYRERNLALRWDNGDSPGTIGVMVGGGYAGTSIGTIQPNQWYHIVGTFDGTTLSAYKNGVFVSSVEPGTPDDVGDPSSFEIGCRDTITEYFNGSIDEVRIYNRALSTNEITELYRLGASRMKVNTPDTKAGPQSGLVGNWTFNGPDINNFTNSAFDRSSSYATGTMTNMATSTRAVPGISGQALKFDGSDDGVNLGTPGALSNITVRTIVAWIYPRNLGEGSKGAIMNSANSTTGWSFHFCSNDVTYCTSIANTIGYIQSRDGGTNAGNWTFPANTVNFNQWQQVAFVYDRSSVSNDPVFYYNGSPVAVTEVFSYGTTVDSDSSISKGIGYSVTEGYTFDGLIDEVRVYNRALSASEITDLYTAGAARVKIRQ